ncbi:hypothetical protein GH714_018345 [Hevea brasiliensis]|uniref:Uncharacterized protein n=1 Tax=Hevea brasiliensis TaxID=3981 RepID=A0A6A6LV03_HEVBR|nr:hypothetical protein GH714_018345 [Hevea brasiliensis]
MDSWVGFAVGRDVEDLTLDFSLDNFNYELEFLGIVNSVGYYLPQFLHHNSRLRNLKTGCYGTPVLETLKLLSCVGIYRLDLSLNSHLKELVIHGVVF